MKHHISRAGALMLFGIAASVSVSAQTGSPCDGVIMPAGAVCISQATANAAVANKRELDATKLKIEALEDALKAKDGIIADNKRTASQNEADLKAALTNTAIDLATTKGQLIGAEANSTRQLAIIDLLLKGQKKKCLPFSICF